MKQFIIILSLCSVSLFSVYSQQEVMPRVKAQLWYDFEKQQKSTPVEQSEKGISKSNIHKSTGVKQDSLRLLNFHRVKTFEQEKTSIKTRYEVKDFSRLTVIVVYHSPDTVKEHGIWSVQSSKGQLSGLTDRRLLRQKSEYVYPVKRRGVPLINTSMQSFPKNRAKTDSNYFVLGETTLPDSTLCYYSGDIAEYLVFDRFLQKTEALKIETYLAIKYGITLIASDYLSPSGRILWNYKENEQYSHGIAGTGKDSVFGLDQSRGSSSEEEGLLTIGVGNSIGLNKDNTVDFSEGNYLVWGHNEGSMSSETACESEYPLWERKWLMQVSYTDTTQRFKTSVRIQIPESQRDTMLLNYLVINRKGDEDFTSDKVEYIPQSAYDGSGYVYFENIVWDTDGSGKDMFGFSHGLKLETVEIASCPKHNTGQLSVSVCGGKAPFHYLLANSKGESITAQGKSHGERTYLFDGLSSGVYLLTVTDSFRVTNRKEIEIPKHDTVAFELPSTYWISVPTSETIDAKEYNNTNFTNYVWKKDGVLLSENAIVNIKTAGKYQLTVKDSNGCIYTSKMEAIDLALLEKDRDENQSDQMQGGNAGSLEKNVSATYQVYPNPTTGNYKIKVDLPEVTTVNVRVFTVKGELLEEWQESGKKDYLFESCLEIRGNYVIEVETSFKIENFKLTVVK
jgi:hypothetical protein